MPGLLPLFALFSKKNVLLLTNQNREIFSCILLGIKQADKCQIFTVKI